MGFAFEFLIQRKFKCLQWIFLIQISDIDLWKFYSTKISSWFLRIREEVDEVDDDIIKQHQHSACSKFHLSESTHGSYFIARMNIVTHKHFDSISTRVKCFFNSISKPIESQDYPKNHNFGNLLFEFQWCYIIYSADGIAENTMNMKIDVHIKLTWNGCLTTTEIDWLSDQHQRKSECVCKRVSIKRKWHKNSMNFYWTWNPINHTSKILRAWKRSIKMKWIEVNSIVHRTISVWLENYCAPLRIHCQTYINCATILSINPFCTRILCFWYRKSFRFNIGSEQQQKNTNLIRTRCIAERLTHTHIYLHVQITYTRGTATWNQFYRIR